MYAVSTSRATGSAANCTTAGRAIDRNSRLRPVSSAASPLAAARRPTLGRLGRPSCSAAVRADATVVNVISVVRSVFVIALPCDCDNEGWCCYGQGSLRWRARLVVCAELACYGDAKLQRMKQDVVQLIVRCRNCW